MRSPYGSWPASGESFNKIAVTTQECGEKEVEGFITSRRGARMVALQVLYEVDSVGHPWEEGGHRCLDGKSLSSEAAAYPLALIEGERRPGGNAPALLWRAIGTWPVAQLL